MIVTNSVQPKVIILSFRKFDIIIYYKLCCMLLFAVAPRARWKLIPYFHCCLLLRSYTILLCKYVYVLQTCFAHFLFDREEFYEKEKQKISNYQAYFMKQLFAISLVCISVLPIKINFIVSHVHCMHRVNKARNCTR